jgi:ABC-2 type transport system permease protein
MKNTGGKHKMKTGKEHNPGCLELVVLHFKQELREVFADKGAMLILIGAMIIYPLVYSIGYSGEVLAELSFGVVDLDQSSLSREYTRMLDATNELDVTCQPFSLDEAEKLFMKDKIKGVLLIPKDFENKILNGKQAHVSVYADGSYFLKYKAEILASNTVNSYFNAGVSVKRYMIEGKSFDQAVVASSPISMHTHILYNPNASYGSFVMPGLILIIIQQTLLIGIGILGGSFSASKKTPFLLPAEKRRREVLPYLLGKTGAYMLVSLFNVALAVILVHHWFNYPDKGNILHVMMMLFPFLLSVIFLGIALSTLFRHRESSIVFMVFLSPIALFLSGISWPVSAMPDWIVVLSKIFPGTTAVPAYLRLRTMGVGISGIRHDMIALYIQAAIYAVFTLVYFYLHVYADIAKPKKVNRTSCSSKAG